MTSALGGEASNERRSKVHPRASPRPLGSGGNKPLPCSPLVVHVKRRMVPSLRSREQLSLTPHFKTKAEMKAETVPMPMVYLPPPPHTPSSSPTSTSPSPAPPPFLPPAVTEEHDKVREGGGGGRGSEVRERLHCTIFSLPSLHSPSPSTDASSATTWG